MTDTHAPARGRLAGALAWLPALLLAPVVLAHLAFFAVRAAHLLGYPYPLDYGEGPLLAQLQVLRAGTPIWALYADPGAPPYAVVNYPPLYLLAALALSLVAPSPLLAGRLVSLLAAAGCAAALWALASRPAGERAPPAARPARAAALLIALAFLGLPIVREWSALMRVDMLGVCLGLWGLVLVRRAALGRGSALWPAALFALSLFVKPSLAAAPAAALLWLLFRDRRLALRLGLALAALGGAGVGLLQLASGGWFLTHVVAANANPIDRQLGAAFWEGQLDILRPLFAAGALGGAMALAAAWRRRRPELLLPVLYALLGAAVALGVGKVGAYLNYFLELYAGLVWLAAAAALGQLDSTPPAGAGATPPAGRRAPLAPIGRSSLAAGLAALVAAALLRYYPLWSETYLKPYGLIEGQSPPRVAFGAYGVWQDLRRESEVLAALGRINAALADEVRAAGAPIVTDLPGIAAQAGQLARLQVFEHRQLADAGLWDQRPLLRDMASGRVPLVALDYLGNWLTPEMIALITHRYAQDGSRGPYDLYRPVDPGPRAPLDLRLPAGLRAEGLHVTPPGGPAYSGGELLAVTLDLRAGGQFGSAMPDVVVQLLGEGGAPYAQSVRPLLYGALPPSGWGGEAVQHMQPLALPPGLPPGSYALAVTLREGDLDLAPAQVVGEIAVGELSGQVLGEGGYFVPAPLLEAWARAGGYEGPGDPITPAVPFQGFTAQCFQRACFRLAAGQVREVDLPGILGLAGTPGDANAGEAFMRLPGGVPYRWP